MTSIQRNEATLGTIRLILTMTTVEFGSAYIHLLVNVILFVPSSRSEFFRSAYKLKRL